MLLEMFQPDPCPGAHFKGWSPATTFTFLHISLPLWERNILLLQVSLEGEVSGGCEGAVWATVWPRINSVALHQSRSPHVPSKPTLKRRSRRGQRAASKRLRIQFWSSAFYFAFNFTFLNMRLVGKNFKNDSFEWFKKTQMGVRHHHNVDYSEGRINHGANTR